MSPRPLLSSGVHVDVAIGGRVSKGEIEPAAPEWVWVLQRGGSRRRRVHSLDRVLHHSRDPAKDRDVTLWQFVAHFSRRNFRHPFG